MVVVQDKGAVFTARFDLRSMAALPLRQQA